MDMLREYVTLPADAKDSLRQDPHFGPMIQEFETLEPGAQANIVGESAKAPGTILDTLAGLGQTVGRTALDVAEFINPLPGDKPETREALQRNVRYGLPAAAAFATGGASLPIQMTAQAGAEVAGQALTEGAVDPLQALIAGALPGAARGIGAAVGAIKRTVTKLLPGTAQWFHEMAHQTLMNTVAEMTVATGSIDDAFTKAAQMGKGVRVPLQPLKDAIEKAGQDESLLKLLGAESGPVLKRIEKLTLGLGDMESIGINQLNTLRQRIGSWVGETARKGGPRHGAMKLLYSGIMESIENAVGKQSGPAVEALKDALKVTRVSKAFEELTTIIERSVIKEVEGAPGIFEVVPRALNRALRMDRSLVMSLGADNVARLGKMIDVMEASLPKLRGAGSGSGMLVLSGVTSGAGAAVAGVPGAMVGAMGGPALHRAISDRIARAVLTERGRSFLAKTFAESKGKLGNPWLTALFAESQVSLKEMMDTPVQDRRLQTPSESPTSTELEQMFFGRGTK